MGTERISVVIPTLNEEGNVRALVGRLDAAFSRARIGYELVFIDDHSADRTRDILRNLAEDYPVSVYLKQGARGKAQSLLEGFAQARYELVGMIDADLQYPPEAIPEMIEKIQSGFDVVVVSRRERHVSFVRKVFSKTFAFLFVRLLHGFNFDVQAGLKVFRKSVIREIKIKPTPWTFDLEFLVRARHAGYSITSIDIVFDERTAGVSKVNLLRTSIEIGWNAIKLRFAQKKPIHIPSKNENSMIGAGVAHKQKRFITHTTLHHSISAIQTFTHWQKTLLGVVVGLCVYGFIVAPFGTAIVCTALLSTVYFFDFVFNFYLVAKSLSVPSEIISSPEELDALDNANLPIYSILCPLYREAHILPGFLSAIEKIDWPKDRLDVMLLLEENDQETIDVARSMALPRYVRVVVVPHSMPKTKPKACNYGLGFAKGEYLVIYDAEDIPDPFQLKKAYLGFQKVPRDVRCLQAKLNYFNPHQNLLTRFFTAEYSLWFDLVLTGLQTLNTSIPLGGTSNHFRTEDLRELEGWDPFNVTEDCDLGVRLFKKGYTTAIIDSVTLEEANSNVRNWIRQRSRWIKGYMQTYLVHMRHPIKFVREFGVHAFIFQLNVGGKIAFMLINPLLWVATISYFTMYALVGPTIESLYPSAIFYMAAVSAIFGNFLCIYYYMIGCAKRGHWPVVKYVFFIPIYWFLASIAACMATYQLFVRPHFWEKTHHGLHIALPKKRPVPINDIQPPRRSIRDLLPSMPSLPPAPQYVRPSQYLGKAKDVLRDGVVAGGGFLIAASMAANFFNFVFNAYLGRELSLEEIGLVTLISTLAQFAALFLGGFGSTINHTTAFLSGKNDSPRSSAFLRASIKKGIIAACLISVLWVISVPFLTQFFQIRDTIVFYLFTPVIFFGVVGAAYKGFLQGNLYFRFVGILFLVESITKLAIAFALVKVGLDTWVFMAIPAGIAMSACAAFTFAARNFDISQTLSHEARDPFPFGFFAGTIFSGLATVLFLNLDILLVKHFLSPEHAGEYIFLALVGKMIYFFGAMPNMFTLTLTSRAVGLDRDPRPIMRVVIVATSALVGVCVVGLVLFGNTIIPLLLGPKTLGILPFVPLYSIALGLFTMTSVFVVYHLAKREYSFPVASLLISFAMAGGIVVFHGSVRDITQVIFGATLFGFCLIGLMHWHEKRIRFFERAILDFISIFAKEDSLTKPAAGMRRILIFNWRDTKHVFAGGAEVYIHEIAKRWVESGNIVTLFCGNDSRLPRSEIVDGVRVIRRGGFYFVYIWAFFYYIFRFRGKYDIIVDCHNGIPFFTPLYVSEPVYCLVHHVHQEVFLRWLPKPLALFARFLERDCMPLVYRNTKFITVSESSRHAMDGLGLGKHVGIEIVSPGVDLDRLSAGKKSKEPTILYLGRLKAYKSLDILIKAFRIVVSNTPSARLVIAGSGEEESALRKLARDLQIEQHVDFKGRVSEEEKITLLQNAWMLVNPSMMEGWGITTIEANACGTPIVASDVPGLRDSIRTPHTGFLVPYGDWREFAARMEMIIEDTKLRDAMGKNAESWAQNFRWEVGAEKFYNIVAAARQ